MKIDQLTLTCPYVPTQWEGRTDTGLYIYGRSRHSHGYVYVGEKTEYDLDGPVDVCTRESDNNVLTYTLHGGGSNYNCCSPNHLHRLIQLYVAMIDKEQR